jgi:hypothetical protein
VYGGEMRNEFWLEGLKEREQLEDQNVNNIKMMLRK